jgi:hypothetical protein
MLDGKQGLTCEGACTRCLVSMRLHTMWMTNPKAYYFQQAQNGLYARQAIICKVLGIEVK